MKYFALQDLECQVMTMITIINIQMKDLDILNKALTLLECKFSQLQYETFT